ncbi:MAG: GNAT family N-acetyltransferase [Sphaerospermopsis kisseleviana]
MIEVKQYTGNISDLLNWELDLEFWEDTLYIIECHFSTEELAAMEVWFAYDKKRIVGFIYGEYDRCIRIAVDYRYRNQGIGKQLVALSGFSKPYSIERTDEARSFWTSTGYKFNSFSLVRV